MTYPSDDLLHTSEELITRIIDGEPIPTCLEDHCSRPPYAIGRCKLHRDIYLHVTAVREGRNPW